MTVLRERRPNGVFDFAVESDRCPDFNIFWKPADYPRVLRLLCTGTVADDDTQPISVSALQGAATRQSEDDLYVIWSVGDRTHRLVLDTGAGLQHFDAVLLPLDHAFETRLHAAGRFWRELNGRRPGPEYGALPRRSKQLLVLVARAFDARKAGATYREIADALMSQTPIPPREWRDHRLKHRVRETLIKADRLINQHGYRDLLFYPHSRKKRRKRKG